MAAKKQDQKVDKRTKAYRDSVKKLPKVKTKKYTLPDVEDLQKDLGKIYLYKAGIDPLQGSAKLSQQGYEQEEKMRDYVPDDAPHSEQIKEIRVGLKDIWAAIGKLQGQVTKLETIVG